MKLCFESSGQTDGWGGQFAFNKNVTKQTNCLFYQMSEIVIWIYLQK